MSAKKIVGLGGGSLYFPGALADLATTRGLSGSEVVLYDLDIAKAERMAALGRRLAAEASADLRVRAAAGLADALDGADFAVSSIGGSGAEVTRSVYDSSFHASDMGIPARYGIHQVIGDTCGPAGMMMALRAIPAYLQIAREMEKRCPRAILLNHSNPMAPLMRALHKYTGLTAIGICHGVQGGIREAAAILEVPPQELECVWIGTNHYYWFTRIARRGQDLLPLLLQRMEEREAPPAHAMSWELSRAYGHRIVYPDDGHIVEFYPFAAQAQRQGELPYALAESARKHGFDEDAPAAPAAPPSAETRARFFEQYQALLDEQRLPESGARAYGGEELGGLIDAIAGGRRALCIANVANQGAVPNLPATAEVEVEAVTDSLGVRPLVMGDAPPVLKGILEKRFAWHELVADAAVKGDRRLALQALLTDEMAIAPSRARPMLDELLEASRALLPQFFP